MGISSVVIDTKCCVPQRKISEEGGSSREWGMGVQPEDTGYRWNVKSLSLYLMIIAFLIVI